MTLCPNWVSTLNEFDNTGLGNINIFKKNHCYADYIQLYSLSRPDAVTFLSLIAKYYLFRRFLLHLLHIVLLGPVTLFNGVLKQLTT